MSVPMDPSYVRMGVDPQLANTSNWTIDVSDVRTVKVSNISLSASVRDVKEFFSFSGDIEYVETQSESERSQLAYVTFKDSQGADTAVLLSGATIVDMVVNITPAENYQLPPEALAAIPEGKTAGSASVVNRAEDVVSSMLARGFVLGKDAVDRAKALDERHQLVSGALATFASLDRRIGLCAKFSLGTAVVNEKVRLVDERFQVSEITRTALAAAEHGASSARSALMSNRYVSTGASWVTSALGVVAQAARDVTSLTREKVEKAAEEKKETIHRQRAEAVSQFAEIHLDNESPLPEEPPADPAHGII